MNPYLLQWFLVTQGYNVGPIDGIIGPKTRKAIRSYQAANKMIVDGTVTMALVNDYERKAMPDIWPGWLNHGIRYLGIEEMPGSEKDEPTIMEWAKLLNVKYDGDHVPWCGLFVGAMLKKYEKNMALPDAELRARAYLKIGKAIQDAGNPPIFRGV